MQQTWTASLPEWVRRSDVSVADLWWLAVSMIDRHECGEASDATACAWAQGAQAALGWVTGGMASPIGGIEVQPVTRAAADAEARSAASWASSLEAAGPACREAPFKRMVGICGTLMWLLDAESASIPVKLPIRTPDGEVAGPIDLFAAAAAEFGRPLTEDERRRVHEWSLEEATHSWELSMLIEDTRDRVLAEHGQR